MSPEVIELAAASDAHGLREAFASFTSATARLEREYAALRGRLRKPHCVR